MTVPELSIRNLVKFHLMPSVPNAPGAAFLHPPRMDPQRNSLHDQEMKEKRSGTDGKLESNQGPVCSEPVAIPRGEDSVTPHPEPNAVRTTRSFSLMRPSFTASSSAIGIDAAVVFP